MKYLVLALLLSGCASKQEPFKLEDYSNFCPSEARVSEPSSKEFIVYKSDVKIFYILPGDYVLSSTELLRMPQPSSTTSNGTTVKVTSLKDFSNYLNDQIDDLKKIGSSIGKGVFPKEMTVNYPDKKLAKELVVEKYIDTKNPTVVFCGLTLKSDFSPVGEKHGKFIARQHSSKKLNDDIYSGEGGRNYFTLTPYYK